MSRNRACTVRALVARYYDPSTANFLTRDPLESVTQQPYQYANGDPVDGSDPTGLWCILGHNSDGSCRGSSGYNWAVQHLDPVSYVLAYYANEWDAYENGCGLGTALKYGLEGTAMAAFQVLAGWGVGKAFDLLAAPALEALGPAVRWLASPILDDLDALAAARAIGDASAEALALVRLYAWLGPISTGGVAAALWIAGLTGGLH